MWSLFMIDFYILFELWNLNIFLSIFFRKKVIIMHSSLLGKLELENQYVLLSIMLYKHVMMWKDIYCLPANKVGHLLKWLIFLLNTSGYLEMIINALSSSRKLSVWSHLILEPHYMSGKHLPQQFGKSMCTTPVQVFQHTPFH